MKKRKLDLEREALGIQRERVEVKNEEEHLQRVPERAKKRVVQRG